MTKPSLTARFTEVNRKIADSYLNETFSPFDTLSNFYIKRAQQLPTCGIFLREHYQSNHDLRRSLGESSLGVRESLRLIVDNVESVVSMLSQDVWFHPEDKAADDESNVIRTKTSGIVYTSLTDPVKGINENLSSLLGFKFLTALGTKEIDLAKVAEAEIYDFVSTAKVIAAPAHDGDTFLVFR